MSSASPFMRRRLFFQPRYSTMSTANSPLLGTQCDGGMIPRRKPMRSRPIAIRSISAQASSLKPDIMAARHRECREMRPKWRHPSRRRNRERLSLPLWNERYAAPHAPISADEMKRARLGRRRCRVRHRRCLRRSPQLRDGDSASRVGAGRVPSRDSQPARVEVVRAVAAIRPPAIVLRGQRGEHGLAHQPLHSEQEGPQRRRVFPRRPNRLAARSRNARLLSAGARSLLRTCRSSRAALKPRFAASRITTTGPTR